MDLSIAGIRSYRNRQSSRAEEIRPGTGCASLFIFANEHRRAQGRVITSKTFHCRFIQFRVHNHLEGCTLVEDQLKIIKKRLVNHSFQLLKCFSIFQQAHLPVTEYVDAFEKACKELSDLHKGALAFHLLGLISLFAEILGESTGDPGQQVRWQQQQSADGQSSSAVIIEEIHDEPVHYT